MTMISPITESVLRPTYMEVDLGAVAENYRRISNLAYPSKAMAVVKANAYGHGLVPCADALIKAGAPILGVALVEEGVALRENGIAAPILVFGGILGDQIDVYLKHDLELTASSVSKLKAIEETASKLKKRARVHLKIDTGMERIGIHYYSATPLLEESLRCKNIDIAGIFSHFATSDHDDESFMKTQLSRFHDVLSFYTAHGLVPPCRHIANSAAILRSKATHLDMVRPGISNYGVYPDPTLSRFLELKPAMRLVSTIVYFKVVKKGAGVSYSHTWKAPRDTRVVTIPIGYGDGYPRMLSNRGSVLIRGKRYPIVGNICMDQLMVDIGADGEAYNGDEVVLIGSQGSEKITVSELASLVGTIPYEILTSTNLRVPRRYIGGGQ